MKTTSKLYARRWLTAIVLVIAGAAGTKAQRIDASVHPETGGVTSITISGDTTRRQVSRTYGQRPGLGIDVLFKME